MYINELPAVAEDYLCTNPAHHDPEILFGGDCESYGNIPVFADDTQYTCVSKNRGQNQDRIERNFEKVWGFLNDNGLQINESKTNLTKYMSKQKMGRLRGIPPELTVKERIEDKYTKGLYRLEDKLASDSSYCRTLGMNIQNNLSWDSHLMTGKNLILSAARRQLRMHNKMKHCLSQKAKLQLSNCLILSKLSYGICLWGNTTGN